MNIPNFNFDNVPVIADSHDYLNAVVAEQKRVCSSIDERLNTLSMEFIELVNQMDTLKLSLDRTKGFFARWGIRTKMVSLAYKIDTNRDMRYSLTCARIKRTYA